MTLDKPVVGVQLYVLPETAVAPIEVLSPEQIFLLLLTAAIGNAFTVTVME